MNKNPIITAFLRVGLFWYTIFALFFSGRSLGFKEGIFDALPDLANGVLKAMIGGFMGSLICLIVYYARKGDVQHKLLPINDDLVSFSIGGIPTSRLFNEKTVSEIPKEFLSYLELYKKKYEDHWRLFDRLIRIMSAYSNVPASPVPGGHGGATLIDHSWNVLREAINHQEKWVYKSTKKTSHDIEHKFFPDPLILLAAFAHDIGKIVCYQTKNGVTTEVKRNHDTEGERIVASLDEFRKLSKSDRESLATCLGYYHHWRSIPFHVNDRTLALTSFLLMVDKEAGKKEGGTPTQEQDDQPEIMDEVIVDVPTVDNEERSKKRGNRERRNSSNTVLDDNFDAKKETTFLKAIESAANEEKKIDVQEDSKVAAILHTDGEKSRADKSSEVEKPVSAIESVTIEGFGLVERRFSKRSSDAAFDGMISVCTKPGRLNSGDASHNVGRKFGNLCFIQEHALRRNFASDFIRKEEDVKNMLKPFDGKSVHKFTEALLWGLYDRGVLVREYITSGGEEKYDIPSKALFDIRWRDQTGGWINKQCCIVFRIQEGTKMFDTVPDAAACPEILSHVFGSHVRIKV